MRISQYKLENVYSSFDFKSITILKLIYISAMFKICMHSLTLLIHLENVIPCSQNANQLQEYVLFLQTLQQNNIN